MNGIVEFDDIDKIPDCHGVYFFHNDKNNPIYIGKSISLISRIKSHIYQSKSIYKENKIINESKSISWKEYTNELESLIMEAYYVKKFMPKFNRRLRKEKKLYSILFSKETDYTCKITEYITKEFTFNNNSYGLFKSKKTALEKIEKICNQFFICKNLL